jgi:SHS2 domain-containing protein
MPFHFLEDIATADSAFRVDATDLAALFRDAADALANTMVDDLQTIRPLQERILRFTDAAPDMLLFQFLQKLIFLKDTEQLLLRVPLVVVEHRGGRWHLVAEAKGEPIAPSQHELVVDVKAVTFHHFEVTQTNQGWHATVVLDV